MANKTATLYVRMPPEMKEQLVSLAERQDEPVNTLAIIAIGDYLHKYDPPELRPRGK